jgi:uncharacterized membrane protein YhaH (DUF805 family)
LNKKIEDNFFWLILALNLISMVLIYYNFFTGNEIEGIFQAIQSIWVLVLIIFTEQMTRRR